MTISQTSPKRDAGMQKDTTDIQQRSIDEAKFFNSVYARLDAEHARQSYIVPEHLIAPFINPSRFPLTDRQRVGRILYPIQGKMLLDYGAGDGWNSVAFAKAGAVVWAIDISQEAIKLCQKKATANGVGDRVTCLICYAYNTMFPDNFFDVILWRWRSSPFTD